MEVEERCIGVCQMDAGGRCLGCGRTEAEIMDDYRKLLDGALPCLDNDPDDGGPGDSH